jgi:hypothetical protein
VLGVRRFLRVVVVTALVGIAGIFLLLGTAVTWPHLAPRATPVADRFQSPADWELVVNNDEGASLFCFGGNPCPSVHRTWIADAASVTPELLARLGEGAGWKSAVAGDCVLTEEDARYVSGGATTCDVRGVDDGFAVWVRVDVGTVDLEHAQVHLSVRPLRPDAQQYE